MTINLKKSNIYFFSLLNQMNKYNKLELIGKGSYGTVYRVEKKSSKKIFALKQLKAYKLKNNYEINSLLNELKILCFHDCEYLLKCRDIFYDNYNVNIITDFAKHSDLHNYIQKYKTKNRKINEKIIWTIFIKCCYGIDYLHQHNIIHRDLKPANILLNENSTISIADFGISKIVEKKISSYTMIGTPYYISPEMYSDKNYDKKIDIWSLGCILYEMMTFNVPFQANDILGLKHKIINGIYYKDKSNFYSNELNYMVRYLLNIDPKLRPSIYQIISSNTFKKKEHELNLSNSNDFNLKVNDKLRHAYKIPDKSLSWNNLIIDIDQDNDNKLHSPVKHIQKHNDEYLNNKFDLQKPINYKKPANHVTPILPSILKKNDNNIYKKNYYPSYYKDYSSNNKKYPSYYDNYPKINYPKINYPKNNYPSQLPSINNNKNNIYDYPVYDHKYYKNKYRSNNIIF